MTTRRDMRSASNRAFSLFMTTNARIFASAGLSGSDVYCALALAKDGYGVTEIDMDGLQTYFQPLGSAGAADPLHQVGTVGQGFRPTLNPG